MVLVKPQFEAGRQEVSRARGVVTDRAAWARAIESVVGAARGAGAAMRGSMVSPLRGGEGNVEFLVHLVAGSGPGDGAHRAGEQPAGAAEGNGPMIDSVIRDVVDDAVARHGGRR